MAGRGLGRGTGVALPGAGAPGGGRGTGIALNPAPNMGGPSPRAGGRGTGLAAPKAAPKRAVPSPAKGLPPGPAKKGVAGKQAPPRKPVAQASSSGGMPRKFKVPASPAESKSDAGVDTRIQGAKVNRKHIPHYDKRKWNSTFSLFYPYDKIKGDFELQGLFTRMKDKSWATIYFDMILFYVPTKEGPPAMDDKFEGKPFGYFFLDNVVDSAKITLNQAKLTISLPTQNSKDDLKLICDSATQYNEWSTTIVELCKMFETTPRDGMDTRQEVEDRLAKIQKDVPQGFDIPSENIDYSKAGDWLLEMRRMNDLHRKHLPFIERIQRFSQYRIGIISVYCNFYLGRDRDGPSEMIVKAKKKVLGFWESEVDRICTLSQEILLEVEKGELIDADHLPFHMEDCQIAAFYIDCANAYSAIVQGVPAHKLVMQKKLAKVENLWNELSVAPSAQK